VYVLMCREVGGLTNWAETRDAVDAQITRMADQIAGPGAINPDTWGLEPEHVEEQDRAMGRSGG
jgi:hypothetical protein